MTCPPSPGLGPLQLVALLLSILAAVTAWWLARRRPDHRPVARGLLLVALADVVRTVVRLHAPELACAGPYVGALRVAFHVDQVLYLAWPAAIAWVALRVLTPERRAGVVGYLWAALSLLVVFGYPELRGESLRLVYLAALLAAFLAGVEAAVTWMRRGGLHQGDASPAVFVVGVLLAVEGCSLLWGPWSRGLFGDAYALEHVALVVAYSAVATVQIGCAWVARRG